MAETPPSNAVPRPPRLGWRLLRRLLGLLLLLALPLGLLAWLLGTTQGAIALLKTAGYLGGYPVQLGSASGRFYDGLRISGLSVRLSTLDVKVDRVDLLWNAPALLHGELDVRRLSLGKLSLQHRPSAAPPVSAPVTLPETLELPLAISLRSLTLDTLWVDGQEQARGLMLSAASDGWRHRLRVSRLITPLGEATAHLELDGRKPFAMQGALQAQGLLADREVTSQLGIGGTLGQPDVHIVLSGGGISAQGRAVLMPFASTPYGMVRSASVSATAIDLHRLLPSLPQTQLDLAVALQPVGKEHFAGSLQLDNRQPGRLDQQRLPLKAVTAAMSTDTRRLSIDELTIQSLGGMLTGQLDGDAKALDAQLATELLDLKSLSATWPATRLIGGIRLQGAPASPDIHAELRDKGYETAGRLQVDAQLPVQNGVRLLRIQRASLEGAGGIARLEGEWNWQGQRAFDLRGEVSRFDPARWWPSWPQASLNGRVNAKGTLGERPRVSADLTITPSQLRGQPLQGSAKVALDGTRLAQLDAALQFARNRLLANGRFGLPGDRLELQLDADNLSPLGPDFAGQAKLLVHARGSWQAPTLDATVSANGLKTPWAQAQGLQGEVSLGTQADSPFRLRLDGRGLNASGLQLDRVALNLNGRRQANQGDLAAQGVVSGQPVDLTMRWQGGLAQGWHWHGRLLDLANQGRWPARLRAPVDLALAPEAVTLRNLQLDLLGARLTGFNLDWQRGAGTTAAHLRSSGQVTGVALAEWQARLGTMESAETDLKLAADWNLALDDRLTGTLRVTRESGDLRVKRAGQSPLSASLKDLKLDAVAADGKATVKVLLDTAYGRSEGQVVVGLLHGSGRAWMPDPDAPLGGDLRLDVPSLRALAPLWQGPMDVAGRLTGRITLAGTLHAPRLYGGLTGDSLSLFEPATGVRLREGVLNLQLQGDRATLQTLRFAGSGGGSVSASGEMTLFEAEPTAQAKVVLSQFGLFNTQTRRLVLSGQGELGLARGRVRVSGSLKADRGLIDVTTRTAPRLSDDVVVAGREETVTPRENSSALPVDLQLDLALGDDFRLRGNGLDVRLGGRLRLLAGAGKPPSGVGQVNVEEGYYTAFGQTLDISRGVIAFSGPLDNPGLNVLAKRRNSPVGAGVEVTGTLLAPRVQVVTDESMSDQEKLAWLVLGRGTTGSAGDNQALTAAGALLAGTLNKQIGVVDDIGVVTRTRRDPTTGVISPTEQVVSVGKHITKNLLLGYEYSLTQANQAVKLAYQVTQRLSVIARAGQVSSLELRYTFRFD